MSDEFRYGNTNRWPFTLLDSNGKRAKGLTFGAGDFELVVDGVSLGDVTSQITEEPVGSGCYWFAPVVSGTRANGTDYSAQTQGEDIILLIEDVSGAGVSDEFQDNMERCYTGGDPAAKKNGL